MKSALLSLGLALASTFATVLTLEGGARLWFGKPLFYFENVVEQRVNGLRGVHPAQPDPRLGWIPRVGTSGSRNYWGKPHTIGEHGIRANGRDRDSAALPGILAVGDSFTFGSQVGDGETWPAHLEALSGRRVHNAGVFAYGLDQIVLRAEALVDVLDPRLLIVSFIPSDIRRTEYAVNFGAPKPWFRWVAGEIELESLPGAVSAEARTRIGVVRSVLGYSLLADGVARRLRLDHAWYLGGRRYERVHEQGDLVSCGLAQRLAQFAEARQLEVVVLAQYDAGEVRGEPSEDARGFLACAQAAGLDALDLYSPLRGLADSDPTRFASFFDGHMTDAGNRFVAETLISHLETAGSTE